MARWPAQGASPLRNEMPFTLLALPRRCACAYPEGAGGRGKDPAAPRRSGRMRAAAAMAPWRSCGGRDRNGTRCASNGPELGLGTPANVHRHTAALADDRATGFADQAAPAATPCLRRHLLRDVADGGQALAIP